MSVVRGRTDSQRMHPHFSVTPIGDMGSVRGTTSTDPIKPAYTLD
jgi:hypothetical protein